MKPKTLLNNSITFGKSIPLSSKLFLILFMFLPILEIAAQSTGPRGFRHRGGILSTNDPTTVCVDDGIPNSITARVRRNNGRGSTWVVTNSAGIIVRIKKNAGSTFTTDLEGLEGGTATIWHLSDLGFIGRADIGRQIREVSGRIAFSTPIRLILETGCGNPFPDPDTFPLDVDLTINPSNNQLSLNITGGNSRSEVRVAFFNLSGQFLGVSPTRVFTSASGDDVSRVIDTSNIRPGGTIAIAFDTATRSTLDRSQYTVR